MVNLLNLGRLANERPIDALPPLEEQLQGWRDASISPSGGFERGEHALPGGSSAEFDWQLPLAPPRSPLRNTLLLAQESSLDDESLRFPLRDALLSEVTPTFLSGVLGSSGGGPLSRSVRFNGGPHGVAQTEKSKARAVLGKQKRVYMDAPEGHLTAIPTPPPHKSVTRPTFSRATQAKQDQLKRDEMDGSSWPIFQSASSPVLGAGSEDGSPATTQVRGTWTSAARAVLAHSRAGPPMRLRARRESSTTDERSTPDWHQGAVEPWPALQHSAHETASWRGLPKQVARWAKGGLEFTDKGIGIGERSTPMVNMEGPGLIYQAHNHGNIASWSSVASKQTKQASAKYASCEVHRIGTRREDAVVTAWERQRPGPGSYELGGFVDELGKKSVKRQPKKNAVPDSPK
mmetsp:Transcript_27682/g.50589  ORF Transcript_27682/g.50589 Transcript_27682/m.50589 type:complete len:404 (-) Transcript_27682:117-1328(-)